MKKFHITECACMKSAKISSAPGRIDNVKILGFDSANSRRYTQEAVAEALTMYEGCPVNVDHPKRGPTEQRSLHDRFGKLVNVQMQGDGLRGTLVYNPEHPLAKSVAWYARYMPDMLGLSHNALGEGKQEGGVFVVEKIHKVRSVDLVSDPATTRGLFEAMDDDLMSGGEGDMANLDAAPTPAPAPSGDDYKAHLGSLVAAIVDDPSLSKEEKRAKVLTALDLLDDESEEEELDEPMEEVEETGDEEDDAGGEETPSFLGDEDSDEDSDDDDDEDEVVESVREELGRLRRERNVRQLAEAMEVPSVLLTSTFVEAAAALKTPNKIKQFLRESKLSHKAKSPKSAGKGAGRQLTMDEFVASIMGDN